MKSALVRRADVLAFVLIALTVVVAAAAIEMQLRYSPGADAQAPLRIAELLAWGLTAAVLLARRPDLSLGWILAIGAIVEVLYLSIGLPAYIAFEQGHGSSLQLWAYSIAGTQWIPDVLIGLVFCRFPSGKPVGRAWSVLDRVIRWGIVVAAVAGFLEDWSGNASIGDTARLIDHTPIPQIASWLLITIPVLVLLSSIAGVSVVVRWFRARDLERRQLAWIASLAVIQLVAWPITVSGPVSPWLLVASSFAVPVAVLVPILRYDLWAIDSIVRRSATHHLKGGGTLDGIVRSTSDLLKLPYVAVRRGDVVVASVGEEPAVVETWPITHEGDRIGDFVAAPRFGHPEIGTKDRHVITAVTGLIAGSLRAESLTSDLLDARQRLVTAREEERRRLRRDLHDGIGPMLTGLGLSLDAARVNPERQEEFLTSAKDASGEVIRSLRELVYDLRPPALDDLGFAGALKLQIGQVAGHLSSTTTVPEELDLPAAVEVAALRTAVEAVNNVVKHSQATAVSVLVELDDDLVLTVTDDGRSTDWGTAGVGLASMRERAEELGGTLEAGPTPAGGRVRATYPVERTR